MMNQLFKIGFTHVVLLSSIAIHGGVLAEDRLDLDETSIQGASELPKVLYIVPWKKSSVNQRPIELNRLVDEIIAPVDPEVLRRQVNFYNRNSNEK